MKDMVEAMTGEVNVRNRKRLHSLPSAVALNRRAAALTDAASLFSGEGIGYDDAAVAARTTSLREQATEPDAVAGDLYRQIRRVLDYVVIGEVDVMAFASEIEELQTLLKEVL